MTLIWNNGMRTGGTVNPIHRSVNILKASLYGYYTCMKSALKTIHTIACNSNEIYF